MPRKTGIDIGDVVAHPPGDLPTELQQANLQVLQDLFTRIAKVGHDSTGIGDGIKVVGSAGTDEALVTVSTPAKRVILQAQTDNTSGVAWGAAGVRATIATGAGILLYAGDWSPWINITNLNLIYLDALVTGEGVRFIYET